MTKMKCTHISHIKFAVIPQNPMCLSVVISYLFVMPACLSF